MDETVIDDFSLKRERFERILYISPEKRTEENLIDLMRLTSNFKIFEIFKMTKLHKEICRQIYIKSYNSGQIIFKQGDEGDGYFFVLRGCVDIFIYDVDEKQGRTKLKLLSSILPGNGFGELALIYDCPRTATAIPSSQSDIVVFKKKVYRSFVKDLHEKRLMEIINFYSSITIFKNEPISNIIRYALKSDIFTINGYEPFLKNGSYLSDYLFVKQGSVIAYKKINLTRYLLENAHNISGDLFVSEMKKIQSEKAVTVVNGNIMELEKNQVYEDVINIMEFEKNEMIGEYYSSRMMKCDLFFLSLMPCDLVRIKSDDLKKINPNLNEDILKYSIPIYEDDRVFKKLHKNFSWNNNKKILLKTVLTKK